MYNDGCVKIVWAKKLFLACLGLALGLLAAEGAARIEERHASAYFYTPANMGGAWGDRAFKPSKTLGWVHVPGVFDFNSLGFANPNYPIKKAPGVRRVMLIGDSLAEAYGRALLKRLAAGPPPDPNVQLWNLGVGAYNIAQISEMFWERGLRYHPDSVVLFICPIELDPYEPTFYKRDGHLVMLPWFRTKLISPAFSPLWRWSALYRLAVLGYLNVHLKRVEPMPDCEQFGLRAMARIRNECLRNHIPFVAFIFPYLMPVSEYTVREKRDYQTWLNILRRLHVRFFDLTPLMDGRKTQKMRQAPGDYIHFGAAGRAMAMDMVFHLLKQNGLLLASKPASVR